MREQVRSPELVPHWPPQVSWQTYFLARCVLEELIFVAAAKTSCQAWQLDRAFALFDYFPPLWGSNIYLKML